MISVEGFFPFMLILDRHHVWRSHDQAFHFCEDVLHLFCTNSSNFVQTLTNLAQTQLNSAQFYMAQLDLALLGSA